jgi:nitroreductase
MIYLYGKFGGVKMNNSVIDNIKKRRSIRKYTGQVITDKQVKVLLELGFAAPSAHNYQPWHFIVVKDSDQLNRIASLHPYAKMLPEAGCGIIVCGDHDKQAMDGFIVEDTSAAIQNMLIGAESMGLNTVWCGIYPMEQLLSSFRKELNIPPDVIPVGMVVVGHGDEKKLPNDRYIEEKVHYNKW